MVRVMTVPEAAKASGVPEHWIYAAIKDGELRARTFRGAKRGYRVTERDFDRWVNGEEVDDGKA